jgi:hypothetical protein
MTNPTGIRAESAATPSPTRPDPSRPDKEQPAGLLSVAKRLGGVIEEVDLDELALILRRYPTIDAEYEALKFARTNAGDSIRDLHRFERWLGSARPHAPLKPAESTGPGNTSDRERILRRELAAYRRTFERAWTNEGTYSDPVRDFMSEEEIASELAYQETKLRRQLDLPPKEDE